LSTTLGVDLIFLNVMRLAHRYKHRIWSIWALRVVVMVLTFAYPFYTHHQTPVSMVITLTLFCTLLTLVDQFGTAVHDQLYELVQSRRAERKQKKEQAILEKQQHEELKKQETEPAGAGYRSSVLRRQKAQKHIEDTYEL
jgi:hypothetical protein